MTRHAREGTYGHKGVLCAFVLFAAILALAALPARSYAAEDEDVVADAQMLYDADYLPGDLNGDDVVNSRDVIHARRYIVGGYAQDVNLAAADVNNDLKVDTTDVILMRRHLAGGYDVELASSDLVEREVYSINYDVANGESYLEGKSISNPNKTSYFEGQSFSLKNLSAPGYKFLGWYDGAGNDATKVSRIKATDNEDLDLYAHWQIIPYTVQYESDLFLDTNSATYTVDKGLVLPTPKLSNYVFVGWSDENGKLYGKRIPAGTTGNITLKANWTSERNKTYTNPNPSDPIIQEFEDENLILFTYEIGRIENVPLYTIKDFGYISGDGVTRSATETYSATTSQTTAETISNVVANATTNSSNWTLSSGWNEATTISEEWCKANGYTKEEAETVAKSDSSNWNVSSGSYGSSSTTTASSDVNGWTTHVKVNGEKSASSAAEVTTSLDGKTAAGINANLGFGNNNDYSGTGIGAKLDAEQSASIGGSQTGSHSVGVGFEGGRSDSHTGTSSKSDTNTSGWNSSSSFGGSSTTSRSNTVSTAISEQISQKTGYGKSYIWNGSESQGLASSNTNSQTDSYSSATTYNTETGKSVTNTWTTSATKAGYHRWIVAGTAHVFGVVGYDIDTKSFFVYTYSIMDDDTHEFEDYSYTTAAYNDNENGVISFEVPYDEVMDTVSDRVFATDGLKVDLKTGTIVNYTGTDTCVVIPEYYNAGNGDVVKITGFTRDAFAGRTDIVTVVLSDFITQIPDGAFEGCTSLAFVNGKGVTSIGDSAFAGCTSLEDCGVYSKITHLGTNAFDGADMLYVNAANKDVALAAIDSGSKGLVLNLRFLENNEDVLRDVAFNVPDSMDYFELNGDGRTYNGLSINSDSAETVLNKTSIAGTKYLPIRISSGKVTLNQSTISSPGVALALTAENTQVGLRGDSTVSSTTANAMVCRNVRLYETANDVVGKLVVPQKLLVCGTVDGDQYLQCGGIENIDDTTFNAILNTTMVRFDAGEGTCTESSREIRYGVAIGALPTATRSYCTFDGWYVKGTNQKVTASTILPVGQDLTLVARWIVSWVTDVADGWYSLQASTDSTYSLDVAGSYMENVSDGIAITLWHTNYCVAQMFKFTQNADGTYTIWHMLNKLVMGAGPTNQYGNPSVILTKNTNANTAKWYIERSSDGYYFFRNKENGYYLDVCNNIIEPRADIQCHASNRSAAQKFRMRSSRFALHDVPYKWSEAKAICERIGGHLATVNNQGEQSIIESLLTSRSSHAEVYKNCYWLGGYKEANAWKWVTGDELTYTNWAPGQPDIESEDKIMMYRKTPTSASLKWNNIHSDPIYDDDFYALSNFGFIIEWEDDALAGAQSDDTDVYGPMPQDSTITFSEPDDGMTVQSDDGDEAIALGQNLGDEPVARAQNDSAIVPDQNEDVTELGNRAA